VNLTQCACRDQEGISSIGGCRHTRCPPLDDCGTGRDHAEGLRQVSRRLANPYLGQQARLARAGASRYYEARGGGDSSAATATGYVLDRRVYRCPGYEESPCSSRISGS